MTFDDESSQQQQQQQGTAIETMQSTSYHAFPAPNEPPTPKIKKKRACFGHKETIFNVSFSPCGTFLATASQDSTIRIWDVARNAPLGKPLSGHGKNYECLRVAWSSDLWGGGIMDRDSDKSGGEINSKKILASAGADGLVKIWQSHNKKCISWDCIATLDHNTDKSSSLEELNIEDEENNENNGVPASKEDNEDAPQIYALQFIDYWEGLPNPRSFTTTTPTSTTKTINNHNLVDGSNSGKADRESLSLLLTSSDDHIHLWQVVDDDKAENSLQGKEKKVLTIEKIISFTFTHLEHGHGGVFMSLPFLANNATSLIEKKFLYSSSNNAIDSTTATATQKVFGGIDRNPKNLVYVFDASLCAGNNLLGVALSDGTLRLVNCRGVCACILQLPGCQSHITAFNWNNDGKSIASCIGSGHLILWDIHVDEEGELCGSRGSGTVLSVCRAVLEGGHDAGRPLYGALFCGGESEKLVLSWGVDGKLCVWDSQAEGEINAPITILTSDSSYPLFDVGVIEKCDFTNAKEVVSNLKNPDNTSKTSIRSVCDEREEGIELHLAVGGGRESGFLGVPVHLFDLHKL